MVAPSTRGKGLVENFVQPYRAAQHGLITLPQAMRKAYSIRPGQEMTLVDRDGVLVLSPRASHVDPLADALGQEPPARGQGLGSMLQVLREVRAEAPRPHLFSGHERPVRGYVLPDEWRALFRPDEMGPTTLLVGPRMVGIAPDNEL